jgi:chromate transporter
VFKLPFPWIVLGAAAIGWLGARRWPEQFSASTGHAAAKHNNPASAVIQTVQTTPAASDQAAPAPHPFFIDDHTPTPAHARFKPARLAGVLAAGAVLWLLPMGALVAWVGWDSALAQMGWFFTKAALLTFGGAYAVLPYVYQGAVEHFVWLTGPQMMDGLALGETTPGPLIMVVAFVGFVGGWGQQVLGPDSLLMGAALAATVVTWFTFLPSFVFILAGGPLVESTHGRLQFTGPLTAISAAVVGVIANLALFFIAHVAVPTGASGPFPSNVDWVALAIAGAAAVALLRYKWGVMPVLGACALAGLVAGFAQ